MPSIRPGFYCADSPLAQIELPYTVEEAEECARKVGRAVACAADQVGQMSGNPVIDEAAAACAEKIVAGYCDKWKLAGKGGFVMRSSLQQDN